MKRISVLFLFMVLVSGLCFAEAKWYKGNEVDDFGDPTGHFSIYTEYLSGTYKNQSTSSGKLKYLIEVRDDGSLLIYLFEDGKSKDVTTTSYGAYSVNTNEQYRIQIKYGNGEIKTYSGGLNKDADYKYDLIYVSSWYHDFRYDLINENTLKIVVSASNGSYSLGSIDTSVITGEVFFDRALFDEGLSLQGQGKYQDAITKFNELKSKSRESYNFYNVEKSIKECETELGKAMYNEAKTFMDSGEYQKALSKLASLESQYPDAYKALNGAGLEIDIRKAGNLFSIGSIGPSGGYVFYDKGSYSDGWRYLEAASADLRVVNGVPTVDSTIAGYSSGSSGFVFGYYRTSASGKNLYVNGTTSYNSSNCTGTAMGTGKSNTALLVKKMGSATYSSQSGSDKTGNYAARLCDILTYTVDGVTYDDWFLPSKDELSLMYTNLDKAGLGGFAGIDYGYYWSSSEDQDLSDWYYASDAWYQDFCNGYQSDNYRSHYYRVRPVRAF